MNNFNLIINLINGPIQKFDFQKFQILLLLVISPFFDCLITFEKKMCLIAYSSYVCFFN
jgi:hypothetical protein